MSMILLGNVAEIQNFPMSHQDLSMERLATRERERECIFIPLKIAMWKRYKNAVIGVIQEAIQIAAESDLSTEQRCLRVQHTYSPVTSPTP